MKVKTLRPKMLRITPSHVSTLLPKKPSPPKPTTTVHPEHTPFSRPVVLPDAGNQPDPTPECIARLKKQKDLIDPIVTKSLRENPQDVLHGSRSLNMLIPHFPRKPNDWDIFSTTEQERALELERKIDEKAGRNIAQTEYRRLPTLPFSPPLENSGEHLYRVTLPHLSDHHPEIDIMDRPPNLDTTRKYGITHESLPEAYEKASTRRLRQPLMATKASQDIQAIETHWKKKGEITKR